MDDRTELAKKIIERSTLYGEFRLRSGVVSNIYFDKYLFEADPAILEEVTRAMVPLLPEGTELLAGLEMGGIPLVTMISHETRLPCLFVRKQAKEYGTCRLAEGGEIKGQKMVIIEDVVTSGGAILDAVKALRERGAIVEDVVCVIDRESGGPENLAELGLALTPLFKKSELNNVKSAMAE